MKDTTEFELRAHAAIATNRQAAQVMVEAAEEIACLKRERPHTWFSCDCTNNGACERHAHDRHYAKCWFCGDYEVPFSELAALGHLPTLSVKPPAAVVS